MDPGHHVKQGFTMFYNTVSSAAVWGDTIIPDPPTFANRTKIWGSLLGDCLTQADFSPAGPTIALLQQDSDLQGLGRDLQDPAHQTAIAPVEMESRSLVFPLEIPRTGKIFPVENSPLEMSIRDPQYSSRDIGCCRSSRMAIGLLLTTFFMKIFSTGNTTLKSRLVINSRML